jgi:MFS superfamily sulfate permease-like transporter
MLTAYAIPVSLAYAALAGLASQVGIYGYMLAASAMCCWGRRASWQ